MRDNTKRRDQKGGRGAPLGERARTPHIAIILPKMSINGVQKVNLQLVLAFRRLGLDVDLVTSDPTGPVIAEVPKDVSIFPIARRGKLFFFTDLLQYLCLQKPTHIISSYDDVSIMTLVARSLLSSDFFTLIVSHNSIIESHRHPSKRWRNMAVEFGIRRMYSKADALVTVSEGLANELNRTFGISRSSISVVYNPVIPPNFLELSAQRSTEGLQVDATERIIGFFGRLERQKNVRALIEAFALIRDLGNCKLLIVGEGDQRSQLLERVRDLKLTGQVVFHPFTANPFPLMRQCSLVALPSLYEGFGNVLIEAMACGAQVIATDCDYGPSEILKDGRLGQLVPVGDTVALAHAMRRSLTGEFIVPSEQLIAEGMSYTTRRSVLEYTRILGIDNTPPD